MSIEKTTLEINDEAIYKDDRYLYSSRIKKQNHDIEELPEEYFETSGDICITLGKDSETDDIVSLNFYSSWRCEDYEQFDKEIELVIDYIESISNEEVANSVLDITNKYREYIELSNKDSENSDVNMTVYGNPTGFYISATNKKGFLSN